MHVGSVTGEGDEVGHRGLVSCSDLTAPDGRGSIEGGVREADYSSLRYNTN
jgi:hypothetical protein